MDIQQFLKNALDKLNFLDSNERVSLTNVTVIIFVAITAFRALFGGSVLTTPWLTWNIQSVQYSDALTILFSLWNYNEKRKVINNNQNGVNDNVGKN